MELNKKYNYEEFKNFIESVFNKSLFIKKLSLDNSDEKVKKVHQLGEFKLDDFDNIGVFEFEVDDSINLELNRVSLNKNLFKTIKDTFTDGAIAVYFNNKSNVYRLSFVNNLNDEKRDNFK